MKKHPRYMPQARTTDFPTGIQWDLTPQALERWSPNLMAVAAAAQEDVLSISMFDPIGMDFWTGEGVTAKRIAAALRTGPEKDVVVNLNSPGGDLFEGLAIYNLLREHKGNVTVKVLGIAASVASVIAMAGDQIQISRAGFLMVHNTWVVAMGNRNDLRDIADQLEPFDVAMADIYTARTGLESKAVQKKMDAETWINGTAAVDEGWADSLLESDQVTENKAALAERAAPYLASMAFAKAGMSRRESRALLQDLKASTLRAAGTGKPRAAEDDTHNAVAHEVLASLKSFSI